MPEGAEVEAAKVEGVEVGRVEVEGADVEVVEVGGMELEGVEVGGVKVEGVKTEVEVDEEMFIAWQDGEPSTNAPEERAVRRRVHGDMQVGAPFSGGG